MNDYARKLKELRESKGKTQADVAKDIGISRSLISMYESGQRTPGDLNKIKLANYFKTTVGKLFFEKTS